MISQEQAVEIAKKQLFITFDAGPITITSGVPSNCNIYGSSAWSPDKVWSARLQMHPGIAILESSRIVVIDKETGKILYDGSANDEG